MIEISEENFCYWPNEQHTWAHFPVMNDWENVSYILEQLYAQMMGWA